MTAAVVAAAFGGPEVLELVDVEVPAPGDGEVTIAVRAAGVNPSDIKTMAGLFGSNPARLPLPIGAEVAGVISAVGENSAPYAVGDEVVAYRVRGGWASQVTTSTSNVFAKPPALDFDEAAGLLLVATTAEHLIEATGVKAGDTVLIHGASGSVGSLAAQLAIDKGAQVVGTTGPANVDYLTGLGVTPVLYGDGLIDRVRAAVPSVDVALDTVGTDEAIDSSLALVADRSRIATIAAFGRGADEGIRLLGGGPGADPGTELRAAARGPLLELAGQGRLVVKIGAVLPLAEARAAAELVGAGHPGGKVILRP